MNGSRLATETTLKRKALLAENAAVYPEIEINGQKTFNGFDHVRIRPTFCVVYKSIHQPLRSLAQPEQVKFSVARTDDGHYKIDADYLNRMPDIPVRVNDTQAAIHTVLKSDFRFPVYSLRMVTTSGKIYRSAPVVPVSPSGENCDMHRVSGESRTCPHPLIWLSLRLRLRRNDRGAGR